jgi:hypothetical protein
MIARARALICALLQLLQRTSEAITAGRSPALVLFAPLLRGIALRAKPDDAGLMVKQVRLWYS